MSAAYSVEGTIQGERPEEMMGWFVIVPLPVFIVGWVLFHHPIGVLIAGLIVLILYGIGWFIWAICDGIKMHDEAKAWDRRHRLD